MDVAFGQRTLKREQLRTFGLAEDFAATSPRPAWRDELALLAAFIHTLFYMAAPWLFEPGRRAVRRFAAEKVERGFPLPRRGECVYGITASPWLYLERIQRTATRSLLRAAASDELRRLGPNGDAAWRYSRLWFSALAAMPFEEPPRL